MNYRELKAEKIKEIELILEQALPAKEGHQALIMEAMEYNLLAGGKRLRPMLMKETFELFVKYHLSVCERADLIGAGSHTLDILRNTK